MVPAHNCARIRGKWLKVANIFPQDQKTRGKPWISMAELDSMHRLWAGASQEHAVLAAGCLLASLLHGLSARWMVPAVITLCLFPVPVSLWKWSKWFPKSDAACLGAKTCHVLEFCYLALKNSLAVLRWRWLSNYNHLKFQYPEWGELEISEPLCVVSELFTLISLKSFCPCPW